ncbi:uridine-cytidine kinase-like 1 isoform X1 [Bactrocera neohumeralis]|uniref:uridine-cytidine kinase-like 1 isoform X1 n=1 Tax=Bactrocera neohumeralis TaxID=98809 RepID=UPI0021660C5C|nr:uridine-cytidine kinase-like 1 isoform X1 [Bactrocera neohumeralis]XP_050323659.1 uridine-cytidine kinase-like 1 isoform X1 [Bactrocera neohumeralis]
MSGEVTMPHNGICKSDILKKIDSDTEMPLIEQPVKKLPSVTISTASVSKSSTSSSSSSTSSHISCTADSGIGSLIDDRSDLTEQLYVDPNLYVDIGNGDYCCPASPTTVPGRIVSSNSLESPARTTPSRPARRQRTTSVNSQSTTANPAECIIRANNRTIYTAGRPPWYNCAGQQVEPFVIGVCGGSASGKTTVAQKIIESLSVPWVTLLSMDCFYKILTEKQHEQALLNEYNFDHPDAFDIDLLVEVLTKLKEGRMVEVPIYNFVTHSRESKTKTMYGANVIIFEGILAFHSPEILKLLDMKVFVDTDADIRLARRLKRDISQRGRDLSGVLKQYLTMVKPSYANYIAPTMAHADIIVPRGGENKVAIHLIVQHVHTQLQLRGFKLRETLVNSYKDQPMPESLHLLPPTPQIKGLHTFIRCRSTSRDEFIFYSKRLIRLVIEYALSLFPFKTTTVETPQGVLYEGKRMGSRKICGVSILRAGETMEQAICDVCKDIRIGKILIQTNRNTGEPELYYLRLPKDIKDYKVILMDATVATGAAAMMALRVLLDHDVPEENIILASLLMAEIGVHSIAYAFPKVKIVTSALDPEVNDKFYVIPGIGNFGDRYFGTEPSDDYL